MTKKIQEAVTFIKASREEAITLANDIVGDAEVHALYIQKGFIVSPEPVGYMVVPLANNLEAALAEPEQEPIACVGTNGDLLWLKKPEVIYSKPRPLYAAPPRREWVGLTVEEIAACCMESTTTQLSFYNAIETKLREKNK